MFCSQVPPVVLDVSGPHGKSPTSEEIPANVTVIHMKDIVQNRTLTFTPSGGTTTQAPLPQVAEDDDDEDIEKMTSTASDTETDELWPNKPIVLYIWRDNTADKARVLKVLPALTDLKHNDVCTITGGNEGGHLSVVENKGISSLHFTERLQRRLVIDAELTCRPVRGQGKVIGDHVKLEPFSMQLEIHIL